MSSKKIKNKSTSSSSVAISKRPYIDDAAGRSPRFGFSSLHCITQTTTMMEWLLYGLLALLTIVAMLILSPRFKGDKHAPPLVTSSTVVPIPLLGVIAEFFKSPNTMIKRCYRDYGPVFTIPVSEAALECCLASLCSPFSPALVCLCRRRLHPIQISLSEPFLRSFTNA